MSQLVIGDALKQLASARTVNQMISALDWESLHLVSNGLSLPVDYLNPINHFPLDIFHLKYIISRLYTIQAFALAILNTDWN
jgi:hypothetical protein